MGIGETIRQTPKPIMILFSRSFSCANVGQSIIRCNLITSKRKKNCYEILFFCLCFMENKNTDLREKLQVFDEQHIEK